MIAPSFLVRASFSPLVRLCCFFMTLTRENIVNYDRAIKYDNRATLCTLNVNRTRTHAHRLRRKDNAKASPYTYDLFDTENYAA